MVGMTALEFIAAGVEIDPRANVVLGPEDREDLRPLMAAEMSRRIDAFTRQFPLLRDVAVPMVRLPGVDKPPRVGACDCCGDPLMNGRGGMCKLCELALRRALKAAGRA